MQRVLNASGWLTRPTCLAAGLLLSSLASSALAQPAGWTLGWQDDFDGTAINASRWERLTRRDSFNNEKQYYLASQATVSNGNLRLTATNQPLDGKQYRSGLVRTWQEQTYGRWEVRASLPTGQGMWPAIWLLPRNVGWPMGGEIDIMENRGSTPTIVGSAYHYGPSVAGHQWVDQAFGYSVNGNPVSFHNSMHTYAVEWDASRIRYFVDGVPHFTFYPKTAPISSTPMSLILNLAVGGDYGGDPNASTTFPQHFDIDYVKVYNRNAATRALENTSFETTAGDLLTDWDEYSNGGNVRIDAVSANARSGSKALQMYGRFNNATNNSGVYQELPTVAGEVWQIGAWSKNRDGDKLLGGNVANIKVEFLNANGDLIDVATLKVADASSPTAYRENVLRRTAPNGAVFARAVVEMLQVANAGGSVNFDDVTLRRFNPASTQPGDINLDNVTDAADLDALLHSLAAINLAFDYDGNSQINGADVDALLASAFNTTRGDINLDRAVDFDDLLVLAQNYGRSGTGKWSLGDFNDDSNVGFDDLLMLAQHYQPSGSLSDESRLDEFGTFAIDWQAARAMVPEPSSALLITASAALRRHRKLDTSCGCVDRNQTDSDGEVADGPCLDAGRLRRND